MFRNKYKIEKKSKLELAQEDAAAKAGAFRVSAAKKADNVKSNAKPAALAAAGAVAAGAATAADKVKDSVAHGVEIAAPKAQEAVEQAAPLVDKAHDTIVDDILPKVVEAIAGIAAGSTAARAASSEKGAELGKGALGFIASKEAGQKLIEQVEPKVSNKQLKKELKKAAKQNKKGGGGFLITLGLLATAAAVAAVVYKKTAPQDDPWATPLADPYTGPQSSTIGTGTSTSSTTTTMSSTTSTSAAPIVSDHEAGDPLSAVSTEPVILDSKDQEQYAATTPSDATAYDRTDDGAGQAIDKGADPGAGQHRDDKPRDQH